jgi:DNA-binding Lrp family transcriptional regulator
MGDYRLDEVDKRILHALARDARNTSAPDIAEEVNVSAGTIRNRISQLEAAGVIKGYHAHVDYEQGEGLLTSLVSCTTAGADRSRLAQQVLQVPGVVHVREIMTGREDLQILTVGRDTEDLSRISRTITSFDIEIEEENLVQREHFQPYRPYGPEEARSEPSITDFVSLTGDADVVDFTVSEDAPITGRTLREANETGLLTEDVLVVAIEREGAVLTPRGESTIEAGDVVTLFAHGGLDGSLERAFAADADAEAAR